MMTNEEYVNKNKEFLSIMVELQDAVFSSIRVALQDAAFSSFRGIVQDPNLPDPANNTSNKIMELFETFKDDDTNLDQHLIVILESHFLALKCKYCVNKIKAYFDTLFGLVMSGEDDNMVQELLKNSHIFEEEWNSIDEEIKNFDFEKNLQDVINSGIPLPKNISPQKALQICTEELKKISYEPKDEVKKL